MDQFNSLFALGDIYDQGKYVKRDINKAIHYYLRAAKHNNNDALYNLGNIYYYDDIVERDIDKAIHFYSLAANLNDSYAQNKLGEIYYAKKDLKMAAIQNNRNALLKLQIIYNVEGYVSDDE